MQWDWGLHKEKKEFIILNFHQSFVIISPFHKAHSENYLALQGL